MEEEKRRFHLMRNIVIIMLLSTSLFAYNRLRAPGNGPYVYWAIDMVPVFYNVEELPQGPNPVKIATSAWVDPDSYLTFTVYSTTQRTIVSPNDSQNTIKFVNDDCTNYYDDTLPGVIRDHECIIEDTPGQPLSNKWFDWFDDYDVDGRSLTFGYTITTTAEYSGRIVDTDIVIGIHMLDNPANSVITINNLPEVLVHEMGHFVGLAHTCEYGGDLIEGIPDCGPEASSLAAPLMNPIPLHPDRINMTEDDRSGLLSIYRYPKKKSKGCLFFGTIKDTNSTPSNPSNVLLVLLPLLCIIIFRVKHFSFQKIKH